MRGGLDPGSGVINVEFVPAVTEPWGLLAGQHRPVFVHAKLCVAPYLKRVIITLTNGFYKHTPTAVRERCTLGEHDEGRGWPHTVACPSTGQYVFMSVSTCYSMCVFMVVVVMTKSSAVM